MKKHIKLLTAAGGLAVCLLGLGVLVTSTLWLKEASMRYPASVVEPGEGLDYGILQQGRLSWQLVYATRHDLGTVRTWYRQQLGIAPESDQNLAVVDNCAWLNQAKFKVLVTHSTTVFACSTSRGTRIVINQSLRLGP
jgi:hypothetical protein